MDFSFTEEQTMLRDTVASYLADHYDFDKRRAAIKSAAGWRPAVWKAFAEELGILGASFSEEMGGLGGGPIDNMVVMEELGRALVIEPYLPTVVIGGGFLQHAKPPAAEELIGKIIAGDAVFAFAYAEPQGRYNLANLVTCRPQRWRRLRDQRPQGGGGRRTLGHPPDRHRPHRRGQREREGISVFLVDKVRSRHRHPRRYPTVDGRRAIGGVLRERACRPRSC